ncbi:ankyrin repeat domain-containing protein 26 isoform X1 [Hypanus sabinus]|uniref:ankyrin repeat domain-containing protein 26 isoform X1 n=1 Tax=Hypanus sabinus TaxID=79690 RepID=UPI0028C3D37A|nr:ankyrin repeat domain-containing protein 26 isoform X1 [Hypanus sabinus]
MKKILKITRRKEKLSFRASDTSSEIRAGYELKEKDLGKLHKAASTGDLTKLRQLIKKKNVNQLDKQNRAPLHLACANGHTDAVTLLVENNSKLNICDNENRSPLMKAVQCEQERCVVILLSHDADPNLVDINGYTALHLAVLIPNISLAMHLLEYGAHIDAQDKSGYTPLLLAATRSHQKMAKCLLKKGADVNAKDKTGRTTLMIAASSGQITLIKLLLHYGTDASLKDDNGWTADDYALMNGQHACSHLITEHHTKKRHQSSHFESGAMKEMPSRSDHSAEVNFGFGGPAMNKERGGYKVFRREAKQHQLHGPYADYRGGGVSCLETNQVMDDISQIESFSGESKSAADSWLSSNEEDDVPCSSKAIQKFNLTKLLSSSQQNKENFTEEATPGQTHLMDNLQPVKSDEVMVEKLENDHQDEDETFESSGSLVQSRNCSPVTVGCSFSFPVENRLNSTPSKDKENMFLEEEEPLRASSKGSELEAVQTSDFSGTSASAFQEQKASCKKNRRDLLLELGLEESEVEANTESLKDSKSISEGSRDKSIASSGILGQRNKMNQNEVDDSNWDSESASVKTPKMNHQTVSQGETSPIEDGGNENRKNYEGKNEKAEEMNLNEEPNMTNSDSTAEMVRVEENQRKTVNGQYVKVQTKEDTKTLHWRIVTAELEQRIQEIWRNKNDTLEYAENYSGSCSSSECNEDIAITPFGNNKITALEEELEEESISNDDDHDVLDLLNEPEEAAGFTVEPRDDQQTLKICKSKPAENNGDNRLAHTCVLKEKQELNWEAVKECIVKKEGNNDAGYLSNNDSDFHKVESRTDNNGPSDKKSASFGEAPTELVDFSSIRNESLMSNCFPNPDARRFESPDLKHCRKTVHLPSVVAAKSYLDEELEEEEQQFKNEVGMLKVEFLALEKKKVQLEKEVIVAKENMQQHNVTPYFMTGMHKVAPAEPILNKGKTEGPLLEGSNLGSNEEKYENQHNQERPIKQHQLSAMNTLSAFEDSSASEISLDEKACKPSSNEMHMKAVNISDDLSNLTQLFDSSESDSESSDLMYKIKAQLLQIDVETIDSVSLLKIQNMVQEYERGLKRERKRYALLAEKAKYLANERKELNRILKEARDMKLTLECKIVEKDFEFKCHNFRMKQEEEKRKTAEMLLAKSCEHLQEKESQYCEEIQEKHKVELMLRNLEIERDTVITDLKKLSEENKELQIQLNQEKAKCEEILNRHLHNQQTMAKKNNTAVQEIEPLAQCDSHHDEEALKEHNFTLQQEVTVLKRELNYLRERNQEEQEKYMEQIETLKVKLEDTKKDLRSSENNLTQTNLQYNSQLNAMKSEVLLLTSKLELLEAQRKDQQSEKESILSHLNATIQELECSQKANCEFEQILQKERDEWVHLDEKRNNKISNLCAINKKMSEKLTKEEGKANDLDKKLHHAKLSLAEKNCMLESVQKELKQFQEHVTDLEQTNKVEKEQLSKHEVRQVSLQERLAQAHSEITLLHQQLEDAQNKVIMKEKVVTDVQDKFNNMFATLREDSERRISVLEKRNEELLNKNMEQNEQKCKYENEIDVKEASLRQLQQDLADSLKKLSMSEASLEVVTRSRNEIEGEKNHLQKQLHKLKIKLQENQDKNMQSERKIQQLENALKEKEYQIATSQKIQEAFSTSSQRNEATKHLEEQILRLEIENAKLEAAAKEQTNKSELLEKELKESQSVHARLEDLITNLQGLRVNLEDQLSQEQQNAKDSHQQLEGELKSRSKLGLRLAQLEKVKKELSDQVELEKKRVKKLVKNNQSVETRLDQEIERNNELQRELYRMRTLLKTAKKKLKQNEVRLVDSHINGSEELDHEQNETADIVSTLKRKIYELSSQLERESAKCKHLESTNEEQIKAMHFLQKSHDHLEQRKQQLEEEMLHLKTQAETQRRDSSYLESYKKKMEKQARKEVTQKLEEVNTFLKILQASSETLEEMKASNEFASRNELEQRSRDLEWELNKLRTSQQETLRLKESAEKEIERNKELYSLQSKPCKSIAAQLNGSNERLAEATSGLIKERFRSKSLIGDCNENKSLTTTCVQNGSHLQSRLGDDSDLEISHKGIGSNLNPEVDELSPYRRVDSFPSKIHQTSNETLEDAKASNEFASGNELEQRNRDLEWKLNEDGTSQQGSLNLKESAEKEIERNKELHSQQSKPCKSIAAQLNGSDERLAEGTTELLRGHFCSKSLIGDSIKNGNLTTTWAQNGSHLQSRLGNGSDLRISHKGIGSNLNREEDELLPSRKVESYLSEMRDELRKSINKELAQAYADLDVCSHISPMGSTSFSLTNSNQIQDPLTTSIAQYRKVLKDNYLI